MAATMFQTDQALFGEKAPSSLNREHETPSKKGGKKKKTLSTGDYVALLAFLMALLLSGSTMMRGLERFSKQSAYPSPKGLLMGIGAVLVGQAIVISYHYIRRTFGSKRRLLQSIEPELNFGQALKEHVTRAEALLQMGAYLSGTWMFWLMPPSYYSFEGGVNWVHVMQSLVTVDFFMFAAHVSEHRIANIYGKSHKAHHKFTNPMLFDAFNGSPADTFLMILIPLYSTATIVPCNVWSYMAFGSIYANYLMLIHSEYSHVWDKLFSLVGIATPADHHVHHITFTRNYGHLFTYWDRLFGAYRSPADVPQLANAKRAQATKAAVKKQGSYGKVPTHPSKSWQHMVKDPREFAAAIQIKFLGGIPGVHKGQMVLPSGSDSSQCSAEDVAFCGKMLNKVSRSFASVIRQLGPDLCLPVCVFYLVLRALDTVEDDMELPKFRPSALFLRRQQQRRGNEDDKEEENGEAFVSDSEALAAKVTALRCFHLLLSTRQPDLSPVPVSLKELENGKVGLGDEATLLNDFDKCIRVFRALPAKQQEVIANITDLMGNGMADFVSRDLRQGTEDKRDYNQYCHFVAGLVGKGLTCQFAACGLEGPGVDAMANGDMGLGSLPSDMGLFLQKTNIIRDYLEDFVDGRAFWPKEVWARHLPPGGRLGDLSMPSNIGNALSCLEELIADALVLIPSSLKYLSQLSDERIFRFCAIPQVMAIATLAELYANRKVFTGVVKIRKGLSCRLILDCGSMAGVLKWFKLFLSAVHQKALDSGAPQGPFAQRSRALLLDALQKIAPFVADHTVDKPFPTNTLPRTAAASGPSSLYSPPSASALQALQATGQRPSQVGVLAMDIYFPKQYVAQAELEQHFGVSKGKFTIGLGQAKMGFVTKEEDIYSVCLSAVSSFMDKYGISYSDIGRLEVASETINDHSKSIKSVLMQLFEQSGNSDVEGVDCMNACYAGTNALFNSVAHVEGHAWDGRLALVVAADIAEYSKGPARPTGGCGAVVFLVGPNAALELDATRASHMEHCYDFWKPHLDSPFPVVDGHFSNQCFLRSLDTCIGRYKAKHEKKEGEGSFDLLDFSFAVFHSPYNKLVQKSFGRLLYNDHKLRPDRPLYRPFKEELRQFEGLSTADSYGNKELERLFIKISKPLYNKMVSSATLLPREVGNMYTASLYAGLLSLTGTLGDELAGKKVLLFSYGSGLCSSLFSMTVGDSPSAKQQLAGIRVKARLKERLSQRTRAEPTHYDQVMEVREGLHHKSRDDISNNCPKQHEIFAGSYYTASKDKDGRRTFSVAK